MSYKQAARESGQESIDEGWMEESGGSGGVEERERCLESREKKNGQKGRM